MPTFPERMKEIRELRELTQKTVAADNDITTSLYQKYERSKTKHCYDLVIKLCNYYNVSADYLLGMSDDPNRH